MSSCALSCVLISDLTPPPLSRTAGARPRAFTLAERRRTAAGPRPRAGATARGALLQRPRPRDAAARRRKVSPRARIFKSDLPPPSPPHPLLSQDAGARPQDHGRGCVWLWLAATVAMLPRPWGYGRNAYLGAFSRALPYFSRSRLTPLPHLYFHRTQELGRRITVAAADVGSRPW